MTEENWLAGQFNILEVDIDKLRAQVENLRGVAAGLADRLEREVAEVVRLREENRRLRERLAAQHAA